MRQKITLIIPAFNEMRHIKFVLKELLKNKNDVIIINDGSTDDTAEIAKKFTPYVLSHATNLGKGAALKTGCEFAFNHLVADYVIMMDADEQHSPDDLSLFIKKIKQGHDIILGVRSFKGMPKIPTISNKLTSLIIQLLYGTYVPDIPSGFKALSRKAYSDLEWTASGYEVEIEIAQKIAQKKLAFTTVSIQTIYPEYVRGMTPLDGFKVLLKLLGLR